MKWKSNLEKLQFIFEQRYFRWVFLLLLMWSFLNSMAVAIVEPLGLKYLFDEGIIRGNFRLFAVVGLIVVAFGTFWRLSNFFLELCERRFKNRILGALSLRMVEIYHHLPYMEILRKGADYFVARIYDEAKNVTEPLVDVGTRLFQAVAMVIGGLGLCFYLSPKLTGTLLIVITGLIYGSRYFGAKMQSQSKRQQEWEAELKGTIIGVVHAVKETRIFQLFDTVKKACQRAFQSYAEVTYTWQKTAGTYATLSGIFLSLAELIVILGAGYSVLVGNLTFGGMLAFMNAFWFGVNGFRQFVNSFPALSQIQASADRLMELFREGAKPGFASSQTFGEIWLNGVTFAYSNQPVLQNITLKINKGEKVLIQGPNGSGKSTLALVMAGLLEPQRGNVTIPKRVSAVIRPFRLPPVPLKDLCPRGKEKEANELLAKFGLLEHCDSIFDRLSEGQRTKFAVALALLHEADCYILDEPLMALDQESISLVMNEIWKRTEGKTLVVILHGGEVFRDQFDKVFVLPSQKQAVNPSPSELLSNASFFKESSAPDININC